MHGHTLDALAIHQHQRLRSVCTHGPTTAPSCIIASLSPVHKHACAPHTPDSRSPVPLATQCRGFTAGAEQHHIHPRRTSSAGLAYSSCPHSSSAAANSAPTRRTSPQNTQLAPRPSVSFSHNPTIVPARSSASRTTKPLPAPRCRCVLRPLTVARKRSTNANGLSGGDHSALLPFTTAQNRSSNANGSSAL
jgi:hypothetical protein